MKLFRPTVGLVLSLCGCGSGNGAGGAGATAATATGGATAGHTASVATEGHDTEALERCSEYPDEWTRGVGDMEALAINSDGIILVVGTTGTQAGGNPDLRVAAYATDGESLWSDAYNGPANYSDRATSAAATSEGDFVVGASINSGDPGAGSHGAMFRYASDGTRLEERLTDPALIGVAVGTDAVYGLGYSQIYRLVPDAPSDSVAGMGIRNAAGATDRTGGLALAGRYDADSGVTAPRFARHDSALASLLEVQLDAAETSTEFYDLAVATDGTLWLIGGPEQGDGQSFLAHHTAAGDEVTRVDIATPSDHPAALTLTPGDEPVVVGSTRSPRILWLREYDGDGNELRVRVIDDDDDASARDVSVAPDGAIVTLGFGSLRKWCP